MDPHVNFKILGRLNISIYKPLVTLKISLLLWYTAGGSLLTYATLFFKQKGLTLSEISIIYLTANLMQFFFITTCGVFADKKGKPFSITLFTLSFISITTMCLAFIPNVDETTYGDHFPAGKVLHCAEENYVHFRTCKVIYPPEVCKKFCISSDVKCCEHSFGHQSQQREADGNISLLSNDSQSGVKLCSNDFAQTIIVGNDNISVCTAYEKMCEISCTKYIPKYVNRTKFVFLFAVVIILLLMGQENMFRFIDILTLAMVKFHKAEYGKQKIWSTIGYILGPSLTALVLYMTASSEKATDYVYVLYFYTIMCVLTLLSVVTLDVGRHEPVKKMWRAAATLFKDTDFLLFTVVLLILGATWGFQINFKNVYMIDIGTPTYLVGLMDTFAALCALPILFTSKLLTDKIGHVNIFILSLLAQGLKCIGYSFLEEAWPAFLLELTTAVSFHLLWVAAMEYCSQISPDLKATVIAFAGSVHFSIGRACGSIVGGLLMSAYGGSTTFQVMAAVNVATALFYSAFLYVKRGKNICIVKY